MHHLPLFAYPKNACWECKKPVAQVGRFQRHQDANNCIGGEFREIHVQRWVGLVNQMLWFFAQKLNLLGILALLSYVRADPWLHPPSDQAFMTDLQELMELCERSNGIYRKGREYQMSPPNSAVAMLHWRTLVNLVNMLDVDQQQELLAISTECNLLGEPVNTPSKPTLSSTPEVEAEVPTSAESEEEEPLPTPVVADAHCHVDLLLSQLHAKSYDDTKDDFFHPEESVEVVQIIPYYAFPNMFPRPWMLKNLPEIGKKYTIGFHPQSAASSYPDYFEKFRELAEMEDTIAIGEVSLDYTQGISESNIDTQHRLQGQLHWWLLS